MTRIGNPQPLPSPQPVAKITRSHTGQAVNLWPAHPGHLDKSGCQMPSTRLIHLEGVGVEKGPAVKSTKLCSSTSQPPVWKPWAAPSRIGQQGRCQNKALRGVTGQTKSTTVATLRREAVICNIATTSKRATVLAYEKAHRQVLAAP